MKVKELIEKLKELDQDKEIYIDDKVGNVHGPFLEVNIETMKDKYILY